MFKTNSKADEVTAPHYLKKTYCTNCDEDGKFEFLEPNPDLEGWLGGCGDMECTG